MGWSKRTHSPLTFAQQAALANERNTHDEKCDCDACCMAQVKPTSGRPLIRGQAPLDSRRRRRLA